MNNLIRKTAVITEHIDQIFDTNVKGSIHGPEGAAADGRGRFDNPDCSFMTASEVAVDGGLAQI